MYAKPNPNKKVDGQKLKVFDPVHKDFLPDEGREVINNTYWTRRLQAEDIVLVDCVSVLTETAPKAKSVSKPKATKPKDVKSTSKKDNGASTAQNDAIIKPKTKKNEYPVASDEAKITTEVKGE